MFREFFYRFWNPQQQSFTQLPGAFPEGPTESEDLEHNGTSPMSKAVSLLIKPPLFLLYFLLNTLLFMINTLKPLKKVVGFYDNKRIKLSSEHANQFQVLLTALITESECSGASTPLSAYSFQSLYNLDSGLMLPHMVQGGYTDILRNCTEQGKIALIYLHSPLLADPLEYLRELLASEELVNMVKRYQIMMWFGDVTTSEGLQVSNSLKARQFPFIGFLTLKNESKLEIVCRIEGKLFDFNLASVEHKLQAAYSKLIVLRQQRQNRELHRLMMEQQDFRFQESLLRDQLRDRQRNNAGNQEQEHGDAVARRQWLLWRKSVLQPEPTAGDICRLGIRTASGRVVRSFDPSLPIEEIYAFVELHTQGILAGTDTYNGSVPPSYDYSYTFTLATTVPRVELDPHRLIRDEAAIYPTGTVVVEQNSI